MEVGHALSHIQRYLQHRLEIQPDVSASATAIRRCSATVTRRRLRGGSLPMEVAAVKGCAEAAGIAPFKHKPDLETRGDGAAATAVSGSISAAAAGESAAGQPLAHSPARSQGFHTVHTSALQNVGMRAALLALLTVRVTVYNIGVQAESYRRAGIEGQGRIRAWA